LCVFSFLLSNEAHNFSAATVEFTGSTVDILARKNSKVTQKNVTGVCFQFVFGGK